MELTVPVIDLLAESTAYNAGRIVGYLIWPAMVIALVLFFVRRDKQKKAARLVHPGPPPAGWHPDPSGGAGLRYWDGVRWTEHTQGGESQPPA